MSSIITEFNIPGIQKEINALKADVASLTQTITGQNQTINNLQNQNSNLIAQFDQLVINTNPILQLGQTIQQQIEAFQNNLNDLRQTQANDELNIGNNTNTLQQFKDLFVYLNQFQNFQASIAQELSNDEGTIMSNSNNISNMQTQIAQLLQFMENWNGFITQLQTQINAQIQQDIAQYETSINDQIQSDITTQLTTIPDQIQQAIITQMGSLQTDIDQDVQTALSDVQQQITQNTESIQGLGSLYSTLQGSMNQLGPNFDQLNADGQQLLSDINTGSTYPANYQTSLGKSLSELLITVLTGQQTFNSQFVPIQQFVNDIASGNFNGQFTTNISPWEAFLNWLNNQLNYITSQITIATGGISDEITALLQFYNQFNTWESTFAQDPRYSWLLANYPLQDYDESIPIGAVICSFLALTLDTGYRLIPSLQTDITALESPITTIQATLIDMETMTTFVINNDPNAIQQWIPQNPADTYLKSFGETLLSIYGNAISFIETKLTEIRQLGTDTNTLIKNIKNWSYSIYKIYETFRSNYQLLFGPFYEFYLLLEGMKTNNAWIFNDLIDVITFCNQIAPALETTWTSLQSTITNYIDPIFASVIPALDQGYTVVDTGTQVIETDIENIF